jgi:hypothetical protein
MNALIGLDDPVTALLNESAEWRLLGRLLECPSAEWRDDIRRLGGEVAAGPVRDAARLALEQASEGVYYSVFGPGGPAPPREVSYHASVELGSLMSAIEGDYAAFAYRPAIDEPTDHIAIETGFIAYLRLKEAYARASDNEEAAAVAARVSERFLREHLAVLAHPLAALLANSGIPYLAQAVSIVAARSGPKPRGRHLPVIQPDTTDAESGEELSCDL